MNNKLTIAQLKDISRGQLLGRYGIAIGAVAASNGIVMTATIFCSLLTTQYTVAGQIIAFLVSMILDVLSGIFVLGLTYFFLNFVCNRPCFVSDIFYGFRNHTNKALAVRFLTTAIQIIFMLPFIVCAGFYTVKESSALFLLICVTGVIGAILCEYITLIYSQAYFIMLDFPGYNTRKIMSTSRQIMKGNKARLFYAQVTLIPYSLLALLSCGIAMLWIIPYKNVIFTNFYLDLMHREYTV